MSQKLPVNDCRWTGVILNLIKISENAMKMKVVEDIFFKADVEYPEKLHILSSYLPFRLKELYLKKLKDFEKTCMISMTSI